MPLPGSTHLTQNQTMYCMKMYTQSERMCTFIPLCSLNEVLHCAENPGSRSITYQATVNIHGQSNRHGNAVRCLCFHNILLHWYKRNSQSSKEEFPVHIRHVIQHMFVQVIHEYTYVLLLIISLWKACIL